MPRRPAESKQQDARCNVLECHVTKGCHVTVSLRPTESTKSLEGNVSQDLDRSEDIAIFSIVKKCMSETDILKNHASQAIIIIPMLQFIKTKRHLDCIRIVSAESMFNDVHLRFRYNFIPTGLCSTSLKSGYGQTKGWYLVRKEMAVWWPLGALVGRAPLLILLLLII